MLRPERVLLSCMLSLVLCLCMNSSVQAVTAITPILLEPRARAGKMCVSGDKLFVSTLGGSAGLFCYAIPSQQLLWSASLGLSNRGLEQTPYEMTMSSFADELLVVAIEPHKVFRINASNGAIIQEGELNGKPRYVFSDVVDGHQVIILLTNDALVVYEGLNITEPAIELAWLGGHLEHAAMDYTADKLFLTTTAPDTLLMYELDWSTLPNVIVSSSATDSLPYSCHLVDSNQVAVVCSAASSVQLFNRDTLILEQSLAGLYNVVDTHYSNGMLLLVSHHRLGASTFECAMASIELSTGMTTIVEANNALPTAIIPSEVPNMAYVIDAGWIPQNQYEWESGHLWTLDLPSLVITDSQLLEAGNSNGGVSDAYQRMFVAETVGNRINVYSVP